MEPFQAVRNWNNAPGGEAFQWYLRGAGAVTLGQAVTLAGECGTSSTEAPGWGAEEWDHLRHVLCDEFGFILVSIVIEVILWQNVTLRTAILRGSPKL